MLVTRKEVVTLDLDNKLEYYTEEDFINILAKDEYFIFRFGDIENVLEVEIIGVREIERRVGYDMSVGCEVTLSIKRGVLG